MAIGDVQNRFDSGSQLAQAGGDTGQNRPQVRLPEQQDNRSNTFTGNQLGINNENTAQATEPAQTNQNPTPDQSARLNRPDVLELNGPPQRTQVNVPDATAAVETGNSNSGSQSDDSILLSTNNNSRETEFSPARTDNPVETELTPTRSDDQENLVNQATERTANQQISAIENTNAAVAATPPRQSVAANALTQENQVGTTIDTTA